MLWHWGLRSSSRQIEYPCLAGGGLCGSPRRSLPALSLTRRPTRRWETLLGAERSLQRPWTVTHLPHVVSALIWGERESSRMKNKNQQHWGWYPPPTPSPLPARSLFMSVRAETCAEVSAYRSLWGLWWCSSLRKERGGSPAAGLRPPPPRLSPGISSWLLTPCWNAGTLLPTVNMSLLSAGAAWAHSLPLLATDTTSYRKFAACNSYFLIGKLLVC